MIMMCTLSIGHPERIQNLENTLDVSLVQGNGSDIQLLNEISMADVGMFIAVTDSDGDKYAILCCSKNNRCSYNDCTCSR